MAHNESPEGRRGQLELFGGEAAPSSPSTPDQMRELLHRVLAEARAAETMPWPPDRVRFYRGVFPLLSHWLPEEESTRLREEFQIELARLDVAA
jgi:hypothetical protein